MNIQEINKILTDAIEIYGEDSQIWMTIEEMSELGNALAKYRRGRVTREDVCEEIADVAIMMIQLSKIFGPDDISDYLKSKLDRLDKRLTKYRNNEDQRNV